MGGHIWPKWGLIGPMGWPLSPGTYRSIQALSLSKGPLAWPVTGPGPKFFDRGQGLIWHPHRPINMWGWGGLQKHYS